MLRHQSHVVFLYFSIFLYWQFFSCSFYAIGDDNKTCLLDRKHKVTTQYNIRGEWQIMANVVDQITQLADSMKTKEARYFLRF